MTVVFEYDSPPEGEMQFDFGREEDYFRRIMQCGLCGHYVSSFRINTANLYSGKYVQSNYQDDTGIKKTFDRIVALDPSCSDNYGRTKRIVGFGETYFSRQGRQGFIPSLLDVGSGLGVFPYAIKKAGWACTALDPDERTIRHLKTAVGVEAIHADFMSAENISNYDVITFNKVLEHVESPAEMLKKAKRIVKKDGFIYVEVPDGEMAALEGKGREEFFIDHLHVFSFSSLSLLFQKTGIAPLFIERLKEPSTKYTIMAFGKVLV